MGKYEEIVNSSWSEATLYAESIPHLLHWDLAYFWILEREAHLRPTEWDEQINAWRYLVALLLTDQLDIETEPIKEPFRSLTIPYGIDEISWLKLKHAGDYVGVLSTTVLARPLPDYSRGDLQRWMQKLPHPREHKPEVLAHFVKLAIDHLNLYQQTSLYKSPIPPKLARILEFEFKHAKEMSAPPEGDFRSIPILMQIDWVKEEHESSIEPIELMVGSQGDLPVGKVFIPRCDQCSTPLTGPHTAAPIEIEEEKEPFTIDCRKPTCRQPNELSLEQFLIWVREREVVVWDQQGIFPVPAKGFPPLPKFSGREIQFEWQPAQMPGADRTNRFLRFQFPAEKQLTRRKLSEIFYHKLLVPGELNEFTGLPFPLEWRTAIENFMEVEAKPDTHTVRVVYNGVKVRGLPEPINRPYGSLSLKQAPELAIGIYPNPRAVPEKWKWYRLFLHGQERQDYTLQAPETREILPWLVESTSRFPDHFSLHSSDKAGVSYYNRPIHASLSTQSPAKLHLGVDFGTTNTVIYFLPPDKGYEDFDKVLERPQEHCVEPPSYVEIIIWLAKAKTDSPQPIGDFLPSIDYGKKGAARFITPTVLWEINDQYLICWDPDYPPPQAGTAGNLNLPVNIRSDFKLKRDTTLHQAFLREALLLTLPWVLQRNLNSHSLRTRNLTVSLGFAFPLALGGPARKEMNETLAQTKQYLSEVTGLEYETNVISESAACVKLLGSPNSTDTFLVADMGGGTIDLALFTASNPDPDQIGSIIFAGEKFLHILADKKQLDQFKQLKLGDSIRQGNCSYGNDHMANLLLRRFIGIAFEFLRTMIAAYRRKMPDQTIHLVLAGNGWHLAEVFSGGSDSYTAEQLFDQQYSHLIKNLGLNNLQLSDPLSQLPSSKHLVAVGALKHAASPGAASQLDPQKYVDSKLPAGRRVIFRAQQSSETIQNEAQKEEMKIEWFNIVGEPVPFTVLNPEALRAMNMHIDFSQMAPLNDPWRAYFLDIFSVNHEQNIPYPQEILLKEQIQLAIPQLPTTRLGKGPLQIILENHWAEWLKK